MISILRSIGSAQGNHGHLRSEVPSQQVLWFLVVKAFCFLTSLCALCSDLPSMVGKDPLLTAVSGVISGHKSFKGKLSQKDCVLSEVRGVSTEAA